VDTEAGDLNVSWMKLDDQMHGHRKFVKLGAERLAATGLWATAGSWAAAAMTDGFVPDYIVAQWDPALTLAKALVIVRLWSVDTADGEDGFRFHDWCEINGSRDEIVASRRDAAERQRRSRDRRRQADGTLGPDDGGGGGRQQSFDVGIPDGATNGTVTPLVTPEHVTRDRAVTDAVVTPAHPTPPHPIEEQKIPRKRVPAAATRTARTTAGPEFEEWYAAYPRHREPEAAARAWTKARKTIDHRELMTATRRFAAERRGQDQNYTPYPASWLNAGGYANEPDRRAGRRDRTTGRLTEIG
jgi:hypothetical protein